MNQINYSSQLLHLQICKTSQTASGYAAHAKAILRKQSGAYKSHNEQITTPMSFGISGPIRSLSVILFREDFCERHCPCPCAKPDRVTCAILVLQLEFYLLNMSPHSNPFLSDPTVIHFCQDCFSGGVVIWFLIFDFLLCACTCEVNSHRFFFSWYFSTWFSSIYGTTATAPHNPNNQDMYQVEVNPPFLYPLPYLSMIDCQVSFTQVSKLCQVRQQPIGSANMNLGLTAAHNSIANPHSVLR